MLGCFLFLCGGCKSDYEKLVESELSKGLELKKLPLSLETGMTRKEFFAYCWDLNKQKKISQGSGNQYAQYELYPEGLTDSLQRIKMLFYGIFDHEEVMRGMDMKMEFYNWAPWNEEYHSPALLSTLSKHYESTYPGNSFLPIEVNSDTKALVKVDGNRRITMYPLDNKVVAVKIVDLNHLNSIKN